MDLLIVAKRRADASAAFDLQPHSANIYKEGLKASM